jgi:hypothetical protein
MTSGLLDDQRQRVLKVPTKAPLAVRPMTRTW